MAIQSLAVFCGSKNGTNPVFSQHAAELGKLMAENNIRLIYGGGSAGLMGIIADSVMQQGGAVTGIIPKLLLEWEVQHRGITELIISDDMHERKRKIYSISDAALILPGGFGTLDELFEVLTLVQTERIPRFPLILFGKRHWAGLLRWMKTDLSERNCFISPDDLKLLTLTDDVDEAVAVIREYLQRVGPPETVPMAFS